MELKIKLTKKEVEHLKNHSFDDNCETVWDIMNKIQKKVNSNNG